MGSRYIPPHLRKQSQSSLPNQPPNVRDPDDGYTLLEIGHQFDCKGQIGTLNAGLVPVDGLDNGGGKDSGDATSSEDTENTTLGFIVLFKNQHPDWPPEIFCKSNLDLLPPLPSWSTTNDASSGEETTTEATTQNSLEAPASSPSSASLNNPIPVFVEEPNSIGQRPNDRFLFAGYFHITSINYLAPQIAELIKMLDVKFSTQNKERTSEQWKKSLNTRWAVVQLKKVIANDCDKEEGKWTKNPMVPLKEIRKMGVTEMLENMRMEGNLGEGKDR